MSNKYRNQMMNTRREWVPAIPLPFYGIRKKCSCGKKFWRQKNYEAHYALVHIVLGEELLVGEEPSL